MFTPGAPSVTSAGMLKRPSLFLGVALAGGIAVLAGKPDGPIPLNATKQLFLDAHFIAQATNLRRVIHPGRKFAGNPVLWDRDAGDDVTYGSVLRDGGRFRMWYARRRLVCYAESRDGLRWRSPAMDVFKIDGQNTNVLTGAGERGGAGPGPASHEGPTLPYFSQLSGVELDAREKDPARRYKMGFISIQTKYSGPGEDPFHKGERRGFGVAASPDGIRWKLVTNWATETIVDGPTYWLFDAARDKYVQYGRTKYIAPEVAAAWGLQGLPTVAMSPSWHEFVKKTVWGRAVARIESPDLISWDVQEAGKSPVVLTADTYDSPGTEIYAMQVFPYEGLYIGLVKVWRRTPDGGPFEIQLAVSRDGYRFERVGDRRAFIAEGDVADWDRFNTSTLMNEPIADGDELRFYYSAQTARHAPYRDRDSGNLGSGIGFASIKRDRFVSLAASFDGGSLLTKPVRVEGRTLHLNAKADHGAIIIEVLDAAARVLARSRPWRKDSLDGAVEWEHPTPPDFTRAAMLRFELSNAHLFAVWST